MSDKPKTAEEYRELAKKHEQEIKKMWGLFFKTGVFFLAGLIVIVASSIAWFANNTKVLENGSQFEAKNEVKFELQTRGSIGENGNLLKNILETVPAAAFVEDESPLRTNETRQTVNWLVENDEGLNDLSPGKSGKLTFYIVPNYSGPLTVEISMNLLALGDGTEEDYDYFTENSEDDTESYLKKISIDSNAALYQMLSRHVLFFANQDNVTVKSDTDEADGSSYIAPYKTWIKDNVFTVTAEAEEGEPIEVILYWIWPKILGQYLLPEKSPNLGNNPSVFGSDIKKAMRDEMADNTMKNCYFYLMPDDFEVGSRVNNLFSGDYYPEEYSETSAFFNRADQYLGMNVKYLYVEVSAR